MRRNPRVVVLALFVLLAIVHTWPIASAPGRLGRNSQSDTKLNQWTMAWVAHQIVRDPVHLFDANIFYPERHTLAFSEHLFVQSMMVAPVQWVGGSPVLAYNLALLAGFALTGWATAVVIQRWTGSWLAGIMSGSLMAFNAMTLTRLPHIQMQHMEFFPFALLAFDRLLVTPRLKHALQLALWYVLQSLTSVYFLVFTAVALGVSALTRPGDWLGQRARVLLPWVLLAAVVATMALLPFLWPYLQARREQEMFVRTLPEIASFSAHFTDYLATGGTIHNSTWSGRFFKSDGLFPGVVGLGLTLVALVTKVAITDRRARMAVAFGVPEIFKTLDTPEFDVVVIFPFYPRQRLFLNARYMLVSTAFWKPMVNGYSGYMPTRYIEDTQKLGGFPDQTSPIPAGAWRDARAG